MTRQHRGAALAGLALLALTASAAPPDPARELADRIDRYVEAKQRAEKIKPAPLADDAEFLRRVHLQLAGRIPDVSKVRAFLADTDPGKRDRVVRELLDGHGYVNHFANVWRSWLMPEADASIQARFLVPSFENWLRDKLRTDTPYDRVVHELLTATVDGGRGGVAIYGGGGGSSPAAYYIGKELKPENLAASTARMFLGIRLECAQCHNHPFAEWKRDQFWQFATFFAGIRSQNRGDFVTPGTEKADLKEMTIPGTDKVVQARFPDGTDPKWKLKDSSRKTLADWITSGENPYFARATVNRLWEHLLGQAIIDPVDEMVGAESEASHPELLDELAKAFVASKFDLKFLVRAITASKTYQRSSRKIDGSQEDPTYFARFPLRGMTAEQLYDSVATATGYQEASSGVPGVVIRGRNSPRAEFVARFAEQSGKATESQTSILQALALMNGQLIENATSLNRSELLLAVVDSPFLTNEQQIETLYLAALSRPPRPKEAARMLHFIEDSAPGNLPDEEREKNRKEALADIFWVLLNSSEFVLIR